MIDYIVNRFAETLTKSDIFELFKQLEERYGVISKACEKIGIERKTFYHWKNAKQINLDTKTKVLKVALEEHPIDTLETLARKYRNRTKEILAILLEILEENNPIKIRKLIDKSADIINEYSTPITEYLQYEINDLIDTIHYKGYDINIKSQEYSIRLSTIKELQRILLSYENITSATTYENLQMLKSQIFFSS